jgi:SNF2 family DNA or RNA helicase
MFLTKTSTRIEIKPTPREREKLADIPGIQVEGPYFFFSPEPRIAYNIINRLKARYTVECDEAVHRLYTNPFKLKDVPPDFKFFTKPEKFQEIALRFAYTVGGGGLLLEPGMGKTKVVLDFIALKNFKRSLIVCPKPLLFVWEDEVAKHRPDKKIYVVKTTNWEEELPKVMQADIVAVNYNKAVMMYLELWKVGFDFIGIDEALIKETTSQRTEKLTWLGRKIPHRMLMSGTLVNNSPLDAFAPVRFLEPALVGGSFTRFAGQYAVFSKKNGEGTKFIVGYRNVEEVRSILETVSIVMTKAEWLKLPPKIFKDIIVHMTDEQRAIYHELKTNYIAELAGEHVEITNPLVALTKLIQISNGFVYINGDTSIEELTDAPVKKRKPKRKTIFFAEQPKLEALLKLLKSMPERRGIIWFNMSAEYELISQRLTKEGITFESIRGGEKDTGEKVRRFNSTPSIRWLVCQAKAVNYGITVLGTDYDDEDIAGIEGITPEVFTQIFYSLNFSLETYLQQQDRIHRIGQEFPCEYYRLIGNTEAEENIVNKLDLKLSIRGQILQDIIKSLGITLV